MLSETLGDMITLIMASYNHAFDELGFNEKLKDEIHRIAHEFSSQVNGDNMLYKMKKWQLLSQLTSDTGKKQISLRQPNR